jgi:4-diphosphocytidyl-2-C-methyl-D-erythritol kinase
MDAAVATGADVPVCLAARARRMGGVGEQLGPVLALPPLFAVLVNPRVAVPTAAVFQAMGLARGERVKPASPPGAAAGDRTTILDGIAAGSNDMQPAAVAIAPVIGDVLDRLANASGCRLARMSGSGATCFGLFDDCHAAARAARAISRQQPDWWIRPTMLR